MIQPNQRIQNNKRLIINLLILNSFLLSLHDALLTDRAIGMIFQPLYDALIMKSVSTPK